MGPHRICLPLDKKLMIIEELELMGSLNFAKTARKNGVSRSAISRLWKSREEIKSHSRDCQNLSQKRRVKFKEKDVDSALYAWVQEMNAQDAPVNGALLRAKAEELAADLGCEFTPSEGWISRFKVRHDLSFKRNQREKQSMDSVSTEDSTSSEDSTLSEETWNSAFFELLNEYSSDDIYMADETGLFFRSFRDQGSVNRSIQVSNATDKNQNDRLSVFICANMTGKDKKPLLVIGKRKAPCGFPSDPAKLPVLYKHSSDGEMTSDIFIDFLHTWDASLNFQRRRILLLVNDRSGHPDGYPDISGLMRIKLLPLPQSKMAQPMREGIVLNFKRHFHALLNKIVISELDSDDRKGVDDVLQTITVLRTLYLMYDAWSKVPPAVIKACFEEAGYWNCDNAGNVVPNEAFPMPANLNKHSCKDFVNAVDGTPVAGKPRDGEIVQNVLGTERRYVIEIDCDSGAHAAETEDDKEAVDFVITMPSPLELMQSLNTIRVFMEMTGLTSHTKFDSITRAVQEHISPSLRQSTVTPSSSKQLCR